MKRIILSLALVLAFQSQAERRYFEPGVPTVTTKDTSVTNLPATYGAAANSYGSSLRGKSTICVTNGAETKLYVATSAVANCTGASDGLVVPASGHDCFENVLILANVCLRSASGTISTGIIDVVIW